MKTRSVGSLLLLAVVGFVVLAGCGGGGSSSGSSGGEGGSFATDADAACTNANKQIAALGTPQQSEVLGYLEKTEDVIATLHKEVEALGGSGSAETAYTSALAKSVDVIAEMSNAARNENFDAVREISDELIEFHLGELAEAAELTACAEVPVTS
jgi:ABC-type phosphate transport system substrate-binding protein